MENVPIYVKIDKYKELMDVLRAINAKMMQVDKTMEKISQLKAEEDVQLKNWNDSLADIKDRMNHINQAMYE